MKRYERNRIYLSEDDQKKIKSYRVLLAGVGIGSNIAEILLRIGFESLTIVDGDIVEDSNLNRQNYSYSDIGLPKVEALKDRLLSINANAQIKVLHTFIDHSNITEIIDNHDVVINALDFNSDIPFVFDRLCADRGMYILHPYNIGFAGLVKVIAPNGVAYSTKRKMLLVSKNELYNTQ